MEINIPVVIDEEALEKITQDILKDNDIIKVTRCKDCIHFFKPNENTNYGECILLSNNGIEHVSFNEAHYCSIAVPKDVEK